MGEAHETALIRAARQGDRRAQDQLVESYLPLIYNIVGRALNGHADVDDVVQESVLRMLRSLPSLRSPDSFRSWFVAITMNEIRGHWRERTTGGIPADPLEDARDLVDPGADFVDLTIVRLGLTGQRREAAEATRWLDEDDRALVSLWWLETAGQLSRAEVAAALEISTQHTAVRVQRMKAQLDAARVVVRALAARPRCVLLADITAEWDGVPSVLWRKRLARHARDCTLCSGHESGLVPAEGLLVGLALVPLAVARGAAGPDLLPTAVIRSSGPGRAERRRRQVRRRRRNTVLAGLVAVATLGSGGAAVHLYTDGETRGQEPATAVAPVVRPSASASVSASASASSSASSSASGSASASASPSPSPSATPSRTKSVSPTPEAAPTSRKPSPASTPAPEPAEPPSAFGEVTRLVNAERAKAGCGAVRANDRLATAAGRHSADMAARDYFSHTSQDGSDPGDRITAAGYRWSTYGENIAKGQRTAAAVMDAWMNSAGHRANILNCSFKEIGMGKEDTSAGPVWTQNFGTQL